MTRRRDSCRALWTYLKAVLSHWWTAMSCAVFTFLGVYATLAGKGGMWVVWTTAGLAIGFLFSGTFFAWRKEYLANVLYAAAFTIKSAEEDEGRPRFKIFPTRLPGDEWKNMAITNIGPTPALDLTLTLNGHDKGRVDILQPGETIDRQIPHNNDPGRFAFTFRTKFGSTWSITQSAYETETVVEVKRPYQV
jgi:hypothetical protein